MKKLTDKLILLFATGLGTGFIPQAPGTWGTLVAIPLFLLVTKNQNINSMVFIFLFAIAACIIAELASKIFKTDDDKRIVIDEIAGYLIATVWLPPTWQTVLFAFIIFRILDILKPGPIGFLDRRIKGGVGIVTDDLVAGIFTNILMQVTYSYTHLLGN
jgi:phosphatidylglycerophosphatase A